MGSWLLRKTACVFFSGVLCIAFGDLTGPALAGTLYLLGPDQRNESPLPPVAAGEHAQFKVDVCVRNFQDFAGIQIVLDLPQYGFQTADSTGDESKRPLPKAIWSNELPGEVCVIQNGPIVTLAVLDRDEGGQQVEIAVPPSSNTSPARPQATESASEALVWVMSIVYSYDSTHRGTFAINVVPSATIVADDHCNALTYSTVPGSITVGESGSNSRETPSTEQVALLTESIIFPTTGLIQADVNGDGKVNILDLIYVRNYLGSEILDRQSFAADGNGDGSVDILDLTLIRNKLNLYEPVNVVSIEFALVDANTGEELETFPILDGDLWAEQQSLMNYTTPFEDLFYKFGLGHGTDLLIKTTIDTQSVAANCDIRWIQLDENGDPLTAPGSRALWELEQQTPISSLQHNPDSTLTFSQRIVGYNLGGQADTHDANVS